jgi:uncharacterized membrane protein YqiK
MLPDPVLDEKAKQLISIAQDFSAKVPTLVVRTPHEYEQISKFRSDAKAHWNMLEAKRKEDKEEYLEGCRKIDMFYATALKFCKDAEDSAKQCLLRYEAEQRRLAEEQQRKLDEEARKKREALEAKARAEREEADRRAAELRKQEEEARKANDLARAVTLRNQADKVQEKAEAKALNIESKAEQIQAVKVEAYIPPIIGQHSRVKWFAEIIDASLVPSEYKIVNEKALNAVAQATKGTAIIPGVKFYSRYIMVGGQ